MERVREQCLLPLLLLAGACGGTGSPDADAAAPESGFLTTEDGVDLYWESYGTGPTTLVVPGRLLVAQDLLPLANEFRLITYDTRNRGRSGPISSPESATIQNDVADLETVRRHFGLTRFTPLGFSYMGKLVMLYALRHPEYVDRIVQIGPIGISSAATYPEGYQPGVQPEMLEEPQARLTAQLEGGRHIEEPRAFCVDLYEQLWGPLLFARPEEWMAESRRIADDLCRWETEWPLRVLPHFEVSMRSLATSESDPGAFAVIERPLLTIHGDADRNAPLGAGHDWAATLPVARLLVVEGAAHGVLRERPEVVLPAIRAFLAGGWPTGSVKPAERVGTYYAAPSDPGS